ncbi:MAG: AAA family ATPase, partial [Gillisia sp.]
MLHSLSIKNYALIEDIKIDFQKGFTIITGETGAGKSIMLGALGLLLGKRADYSVMRSAEEKCIIEGIFSIGSYNLESFFTREDLDYETQTIIRREILPSGKSRAFINDTPVTLPVLIELGDLLIDVHGQHQTLSLGENLYQFQVIDTLAKTGELLSAYKKELKNLKKLHQDLSELKESQAQAAREHDYNLFLMNELHEARLTAGMEEELENRYEELNNVETLSEHLGSAISVIQQEEVGSLVTLKEVRNNLSKIARFSNVYSALQERVESAIIELDDIAGEMENSLEKIEASPEELEMVNARLQLIYNLQKKHSAENVEELLAILKELEEKVELTANAGVNLE